MTFELRFSVILTGVRDLLETSAGAAFIGVKFVGTGLMGGGARRTGEALTLFPSFDFIFSTTNLSLASSCSCFEWPLLLALEL